MHAYSRLDTSSFIHFDDKYFRTEGVHDIMLLGVQQAMMMMMLTTVAKISCLEQSRRPIASSQLYY